MALQLTVICLPIIRWLCNLRKFILYWGCRTNCPLCEAHYDLNSVSSWWLIIRPRDKIHAIAADIQGVRILYGKLSCFWAQKLSCSSIPVAARSKAGFRGFSLFVIAGSNPPSAMDVSLLCVLSGRGLCDRLITSLEGSYRVRLI